MEHFLLPPPVTLCKVLLNYLPPLWGTLLMPMFKKRAFGTQGEGQRPEGPVQLDPSGSQAVCHYNPKPQKPLYRLRS